MQLHFAPLGVAVSREAGVPLEQILLLRHANENIRTLLRSGGTVEEYTALQPAGSRYDFLDPAHPAVRLVVVVVFDHVRAIYEVAGVEEEGWTQSLASPAHRAFDQQRGRPNRKAKLFHLVELSSRFLDQPVRGWEGRTRTPVQRLGDGFFHEVEVQLPDPLGASPGAQLRADLQEVEASGAPGTTRTALVAARLGQGRFRRELMECWGNACALTGCDVTETLRASHCKPWRESTDAERLDPANGLPLVATLDALFDAGLITFSDAGQMIVAESLAADQRATLGIRPKSLRIALTLRQREFMRYHREHVFRSAARPSQTPSSERPKP